MKSRVLRLQNVESISLPRDFFEIKIHFPKGWYRTQEHRQRWEKIVSMQDDMCKDQLRMRLFMERKEAMMHSDFEERMYPNLKYYLVKSSLFYLDLAEFKTYRHKEIKQLQQTLEESNTDYMDYLHHVYDPMGKMVSYEVIKQLEKSILQNFKWKLYVEDYPCEVDIGQQEKEQFVKEVLFDYCREKAEYVEI